MRQLLVLNDPVDVAHRAADRFVEIADKAIGENGHFSVALSGGTTPKMAYELLAGDDYRQKLNWAKVHVFFGDERCVSPDDAESNYRMANEALFSRLPIPTKNIHRVEGLGDAVANARLYEDEMRTFFNDSAWPRFDLVLLGMGTDGHTASLFPESDVLLEQQSWVAAVWVEKLGAYRITLTIPAINHAAHILFLVTGDNKAARLAEVLTNRAGAERLPVQLIKPIDGSIEWLVDIAAASRMK